MSNVVLLIMNTGEHIIGVRGDDVEDGVFLEKPVSIVPDPNNRGSMMFIPYLQFCVEEIAHFPYSEIRHFLTPKPQLVEAYNKQFNPAAIIVPPSEIDTGTSSGNLQLV